jgi:protein O-GlcNAc transferase
VRDTVAGTVDDYVALAVRLAKDPAWRAGIQKRVAANKHRLYRDQAAISALEDFLERTAR